MKFSILVISLCLVTYVTIDSSVAQSQENTSYNATITRDIWGVPHIHGDRDRDAAFGLAYAHAEDDIKNIAENMVLYRAEMGLKNGRKGATSDYLIKALKIRELIEANYTSVLSSEVREVIEAYTAGLNYWYSENKNNEFKSIFPISKYDVISGFVIQNLFFSGVVSEIERLQKNQFKPNTDGNETSNLYQAKNKILGSNAFALNYNKTDDGSTRRVINSHQPLDGPVAWYEAHISSNEGWNMMGGLFPGSPFVFVGFNENLGWGLTVNKPDLTDVYALEINPKNENQYLLDDKWVNFEIETIKLPVKIFGPFKWTFKRIIKRSEHGPVIENDQGSFAIRFAGMSDIKQVEQWYRLNKSVDLESWLSAMEIQSIVSFNAVYADKNQNILFLHNAAIPVRKEFIDWTLPVDGTKSSLIWDKKVPLRQLPLIINPNSGWLNSTNQDPFKVTSKNDNLKRSDYSSTLGLQTRMTNRAYRALELFDSDKRISIDDLMKIKFDNQYSKDSRAFHYIKPLFNHPFDDLKLQEAQMLLKAWDLTTDHDNRSAALGVCSLSPEWLAEQEGKIPPDVIEVFTRCVKEISSKYNRIDPLWSEVNFLTRGSKSLSVQGGPDTLRAIYGETQKNGTLKAVAGDGLVVFVEWSKNGTLKSQSIHQYGSATQDIMSDHYDDQIEIFAEERLKETYFHTEALELHTEKKYSVPHKK